MYDKRIDLQVKKNQLISLSWGLHAVGATAGILYAMKTNRSGWGMVGFFILGGMIVSVPTNIIINSKLVKLDGEIAKLNA